jgi:hypothetical protein
MLVKFIANDFGVVRVDSGLIGERLYHLEVQTVSRRPSREDFVSAAYSEADLMLQAVCIAHLS